MTARSPTREVITRHRRATYDYAIDVTYEAGLVLTGTEVKSLRAGQGSISEGAYVTVEHGEAWLIGAHIPEYRFGNRNNHEPRRRRKLLLKAHEIDRIDQRLKLQGYTGVPMELFWQGGWAKLKFGLGKGKKHYDKRQSEREKIDRRERRQELP